MSSAASTSTSGNVNYSDPNSARSNWIVWAIGGAVVLLLAFILTKGKKT